MYHLCNKCHVMHNKILEKELSCISDHSSSNTTRTIRRTKIYDVQVANLNFTDGIFRYRDRNSQSRNELEHYDQNFNQSTKKSTNQSNQVDKKGEIDNPMPYTILGTFSHK